MKYYGHEPWCGIHSTANQCTCGRNGSQGLTLYNTEIQVDHGYDYVAALNRIADALDKIGKALEKLSL
jgi:hypothetical protein